MGDGNRLRDTGINVGVTGLNKFYRVSTSLFSSPKFLLGNIDKPESKSRVQAQSQIEKGKRNLESGLSLKSHRLESFVSF